MLDRGSIGKIARVLLFGVWLFAFGSVTTAANAHDPSKYPDWSGQWLRLGTGQGASWDPDKPAGLGQKAPLTAEYQAVFEANLRDQANGGQGSDPGYRCIPSGMPRIMLAVQPMEIVITDSTTYITVELFNTLRRIYTDGRAWPKEVEPTYAGYSIGQWVDEDKDGKYDTLTVETRFIKGPRVFDSGGTPLHADNQTIVKERIFSDRAIPKSSRTRSPPSTMR